MREDQDLINRWIALLRQEEEHRKRWADGCVTSITDAGVYDSESRRFGDEADRVLRGAAPRPLDAFGYPKANVSPTWWIDQVAAVRVKEALSPRGSGEDGSRVSPA